MTEANNVTPLHSEDDDRHHQAVTDFDNLFADWQAANAASIRGNEEKDVKRANEESTKRFDRVYESLWQIARTPAPLTRHIELKFQVLLAKIFDEGVSRSTRALIESIRADVLES